MPKGYTVTQEKPDHSYFTIIPNIVIENSDLKLVAVYALMKRRAGEAGTCFCSHASMSRTLKVSRSTISRIVERLVARKWILKVGLRQSKTRPVDEYRITDIWRLNLAMMSPKKDRCRGAPMIGAGVHHEEEYNLKRLPTIKNKYGNFLKMP